MIYSVSEGLSQFRTFTLLSSNAAYLRGCNSMSRLVPPIIVGIVATLLSACARDCAAPVASYGAPPLAGPVYGPSPGIQQYGLPPPAPQYGSPPRHILQRGTWDAPLQPTSDGAIWSTSPSVLIATKAPIVNCTSQAKHWRLS